MKNAEAAKWYRKAAAWDFRHLARDHPPPDRARPRGRAQGAGGGGDGKVGGMVGNADVGAGLLDLTDGIA